MVAVPTLMAEAVVIPDCDRKRWVIIAIFGGWFYCIFFVESSNLEVMVSQCQIADIDILISRQQQILGLLCFDRFDFIL